MIEKQNPDQNPNEFAAFEAQMNSSLETLHDDVGAIFHRAMRETIMAVQDIPDKAVAERVMRVEPARTNLESTSALFDSEVSVPLEIAGYSQAKLHSLSKDSDGSYLVRFDLHHELEPDEIDPNDQFMVVIPAAKEDNPIKSLPFLVQVNTMEAIEGMDAAHGGTAETLQSFINHPLYLSGDEANNLVTALSNAPVDAVRAIEHTDKLL